MRSKILSILMAAVLGSITVPSHAASSAAPAEEAEKTNQQGGPITKLDPKPAYTPWRQVGRLPEGVERCPDVAGWKSDTLLDLALGENRENCEKQYPKKSPAPEIRWSDRDLLHKLGLDRVCVYTRNPETVGNFPTAQFPGGEVEADRLALSITSAGGVPSNLLERTIWPTLAEQFKPHTGQGTIRLKDKAADESVRLTFIDSHPDDEWPLDRPQGSQHGFTLAHLAHGLVCPQGEPCAVKITTRQALKYRDFNPGSSLPPPEVLPDEGGHVGVVSNLAVAILAEVLYWQQNEPDKKLILNLSLGWDGEAFKDLEARSASNLDPAVKSVYDAIRFARRSGALVIAAAGNHRGGTDETAWPLLPAAWELRRPNLFRRALGYKQVFAVGGVDWQDLSLPNSRRGGRPRRLAYADHSVTDAMDTEGPTAMYTGTSVSAAVTSSIAAVVWHLRPKLGPGQVMRIVTQSGKPLGSKANFYGWKRMWLLSKLMGTPPGRRLSLCSALVRACGKDGSRCSALASLPPTCPQAPEPFQLGLLLQGLHGQESKATPADASSIVQLVDVASQRWVTPQPEDDPCPGCTLVPKPPNFTAHDGYELVLAISEKWRDAVIQEVQEKGIFTSLESATLRIDCSGRRSPMFYNLNLTASDLVFGPLHRVSLPDDGISLARCTAQVTFKAVRTESGTSSEISILNPVAVAPTWGTS